MCIHTYDINDDGVPELVTGWASGKVDIRSIEDGKILYKDIFGSAIAEIVQVNILFKCANMLYFLID